MNNSPLIIKSKEFALKIIRVCNEIKNNKKESVITSQLSRSGTSIGANIREAFFAQSKADFIAKLHIALKECSESEYWLEILIESNYYSDKSVLSISMELGFSSVSYFNKIFKKRYNLSPLEFRKRFKNSNEKT